jgi:hypothetical protein
MLFQEFSVATITSKSKHHKAVNSNVRVSIKFPQLDPLKPSLASTQTIESCRKVAKAVDRRTRKLPAKPNNMIKSSFLVKILTLNQRLRIDRVRTSKNEMEKSRKI